MGHSTRSARSAVMSVRFEEQAQGDAIGEVRGDRNDWGLRAVVEAEQSGRFEGGRRAWPGPVRREARVHAGEERDEHGECHCGVQQAEERAEPPGGTIE